MATIRILDIYITKYSSEQRNYVGRYEQRLYSRSNIVYFQIVGIVNKFQCRRQICRPVGQAEYFLQCKSHVAISEVYLSSKISKCIQQDETIWKFIA